MNTYIIRRLIQVIPVLFIASIITFSLMHLVPGDPVAMMLGEDATQADIEHLRRVMGLDRPIPVQYVEWMGGILQGDFGRSLRDNREVLPTIISRIPASFELSLVALVISMALAIPIGILSAVRQNTPLDHAGRVIALFGLCVPNFWMGLMLIYLVGFLWGILPLYGRVGPPFAVLYNWESFTHSILPAITLGTAGATLTMRLLRSGMLEVLRQDYIRTARSKGLSEKVVVYKHALRNGVLSVITVVGLNIGQLLGGSVIVETVFSWPGVGRLVFERFIERDIPMVMGTMMFYGLVFCLNIVIIDIMYAYLDPRIRYD